MLARSAASIAKAKTMADAASELQAEDGGLRRVAKDLFSGAVGGAAQVLLGKS